MPKWHPMLHTGRPQVENQGLKMWSILHRHALTQLVKVNSRLRRTARGVGEAGAAEASLRLSAAACAAGTARPRGEREACLPAVRGGGSGGAAQEAQAAGAGSVQGLRCASRAAPELFNLRLYPPRSPLLLPPRRESRCQQGRVSAERTHGLQAAGRGAVELPV
jgi:hypothetical protein